MSRNSPPATPLWPLIYGLGIVAFSIFLLAVRAGIAIFLIFMTVGVAMIIFWVYYNARTKQNSDIKFNAKQNRKRITFSPYNLQAYIFYTGILNMV